MVEIVPSILAADFTRLGEDIAKVEKAGISMLHLDVMDGHFVPNLTFGPPVIKALRPHSRKTFDAHLMVERPEDLIPAYVEAGVNALTVHAEVCRHLQRTLSWIRSQGVMAGVALNPATPLSAIEEVVPDLDLVLIMTVNPGYGGQRFIPASLDKIARARQLLHDLHSLADLEVDGGISRETILACRRAGADAFVAGNAVFSAAVPRAEIGALRDAAAELV